MLGGVAEINSIRELSLKSVGGHLTNVYSKEDMVLKYILRGWKFSSKPCGLKHVYGD